MVVVDVDLINSVLNIVTISEADYQSQIVLYTSPAG
jgi:hypothetical protein